MTVPCSRRLTRSRAPRLKTLAGAGDRGTVSASSAPSHAVQFTGASFRWLRGRSCRHRPATRAGAHGVRAAVLTFDRAPGGPVPRVGPGGREYWVSWQRLSAVPGAAGEGDLIE